MRYLVIIGLAIIAGILIRIKREYKNRILLCFGVLIALMSGLYDIRLLGKLLPIYRPLNQTFYQTEFLENGEYPDSLLMLLFRDKTVYVKKDEYYVSDAEGHGKNFLYAYHHSKDICWFLDYAGATVVCDEDVEKVPMDKVRIESDFKELGITSDMFRYCFLYNDIPDEPGNYFSYYWYYYEYLKAIKAYMNISPDGNGKTVFDSDELMIIWNTVDGVEEEDIFIMTKDYYDNNVKGSYPKREDVGDE